ncbi:MAG: efflux RND transporter permease subunit [Burkholderiales bacterium]|nr:efflux RND transporter permease subunit [Burkholderiales bacterium]
MNLSRPFVRRPIGTVLLTAGIALAGIAAFFRLPVAPLPAVDLPVIQVNASIPGASPETMASSVATPLERHLGTIAGVNEITSSSSTGNTQVTLQFDLGRDIDGAARDVQAAINAARVDLPATLRSNPSYRKANPAAAPVMILALTSKTKTPGQVYDEVSTTLNQRLLQVDGVGDVQLGGASLPAVRIELNPFKLNQYGISTEDVRAAIQASNANRPKGLVQGGGRRLQIYTQTPGLKAADYAPMVIAWRQGAAVRLQDVAQVEDGVENSRLLGLFNGERAVIVLVIAQPSANVVQLADQIRALLPTLRTELPADVKLDVAVDRTSSIRTALHEVELTLAVSVVLVVAVVSLFLRSARATLVPAVATVVALLGTFGAMYLLGFSLNNLSLMALTVATGFVVDDAIVVLENTSRHLEAGMPRMQAALRGAREVGFTVVSISLSLVAVFIPLLFMGGQPGQLFRQFAVTLSVAVVISLVLSLTTTPMMCAWLLRPAGAAAARPPGWLARQAERGYGQVLALYARSLDWALASKGLVMLILLGVVVLNAYLFARVPKSLFPQQDTGQIAAGLRADQSISSQEMQRKLRQVMDIVRADPAVGTAVGFTGGRAGGGFMFVQLKPLGERTDKGLAVIDRLRPQLARVAGLRLFLNPVQDFRAGGRPSNATYQYTLKGDSIATLREWSGKLLRALRQQPALTDLDSDEQENGVESFVRIDRDAASRLGVSNNAVDAALYDAFGQRQVGVIYTPLNQYHVVMEWAPPYIQGPVALGDVQVPGTRLVRNGAGLVAVERAAAGKPGAGAAGSPGSASAAAPAVSPNPGLRGASGGNVLSNSPATLVPLASFARIGERAAATSINHQDTELATTISFNLADKATLADAAAAIARAEAEIAMPTTVRGEFAGTALLAQQTGSQQGLLIVAALVVIYIVLGVLYESLIHPITVLSTLPSAGVGAVLALLLLHMDFSLIALIGVFLLIGIVKKNAILIIDFALEAERARGLSALEAVREACLLRFRPILMTTLAAALGALPLAIGFGEGAELRQPLGVAIIGGLVASQLLTLLTTPVVYLLLDRLRRRGADERHLSRAGSDALEPT